MGVVSSADAFANTTVAYAAVASGLIFMIARPDPLPSPLMVSLHL